MTTPTTDDFPYDPPNLINKANWQSFIQKVVDYVNDGTVDFNINSITANTYNNLPSASLGLVAGEALSERDALVQRSSDGKLYKADQTTLANSEFFLGFADAAYASGATVVIERDFKTGFTGLTPEVEYYMSTSGTITDTIPSSGFIKKVGYAINATKLLVYQDQRIADKDPIGNVLFIDSNNRNAGFNQTSLEDWNSTLTAVQFGGLGSISVETTAAVASNFALSYNAKFDNTDSQWEYMFASSEEASQMIQTNGTIELRTAAAGTTDNAITWITGVYIKSDGTVGIGTASPGAFKMDVNGALNVQGAITVTSTVDGRDIAADGSTLDTLQTNVGGITEAEGNQLENIGTTTISATQWGYLGAMNQGVATTDDVTFDAITATSLTTGSGNDQVVISSQQAVFTTGSGPTVSTTMIAIKSSSFNGISVQGTDQNLRISGNLHAEDIVSATGSNNDINITPDGSGDLIVSGNATKITDSDASTVDFTIENTHASGLTRLLLTPNSANINGQLVADDPNSVIKLGSSSGGAKFLYLSTSDGGWYTEGATGSSQGPGTINSKGMYDDSVLLTDYVFEKYFDGKPVDEKHKNYKMRSFKDELSFVEKNKHLSTIIGREEWEEKNGKQSLGLLATQLWETIETHFLYLKEVNERIEELEAA